MKPLKPLASWLGIVLLLLVPASVCAQSETPRAPLATFDYDAEVPLDIREGVALINEREKGLAHEGYRAEKTY